MGHENVPEEGLGTRSSRGQAGTGNGKHLLAGRQAKGPEVGQEGEDKGPQGLREEGGKVSQKGLHSGDLWGLKRGRKGYLLRPDASELQEGKIGK